MTAEFTRRNLFKIGGLAAAGLGGAALLGACSPAGNATGSTASDTPTAATGTTTVAGHVREGLPSFLAAPEPITDIAETKDYDVVIVGAGASGVPAAITAREAGATVALIQKESTAISQGNTATGILLDTSDPAGVEAVVSRLIKDHQYRGKREQVELWAKNSGECITWLLDLATAQGAQISDSTMKWTAAIKEVNGYPMDYLSIDFGPKPYNTGNGMQVLAEYAASQGVEVFYDTEAKQLVGDASGVTGVIAETADGNVQFNAAKGVILATGDYQNDDDMMAYYLPDLQNLGRKQMNKTGDGHKMAVWAGGAIEDITHTKMLHDFDGGPGSMADMPFLAVKNDGTRFCNENRSEMATMGNFLKSEEDQGWYTQVFDSNYMTDCADWPGALIPPEAMVNYMPEVEGEKEGVYDTLINTYAADTIEELGEKLGLTDVAAFAKTVARYNELCALGVDEDMGKAAKWLKPIVTPPFYGIHRRIGLSTIIHGVNVNADMQVLDKDGAPIEGLYSIGNCAGNFFGSPDYPMTVPGLSLGRCHTQGYVVGRAVAGK